MNKITQAFLAMAASVALVSCNSSTTAPKAVSSSSAVALGSSSIGASSSSFVHVVVSSSSLKSSSSIAGSSSSSALPISSGTLVDSRDGQTYKTVMIGSQTWMAQNLNYNPTNAPYTTMCYNYSSSICTTSGRLYEYLPALTACPSGWHLPDTTEWNTLEENIGGTATAGTKLKTVSGWDTSYSDYIAGTDVYGFSALPVGYYYYTFFEGAGDYSYWWTAVANGNSAAYSRGMYYGNAYMSHLSYYQTYGFSIRCLKDTP